MNLSKRSGDKELFSGEQSSKENIFSSKKSIKRLLSILLFSYILYPIHPFVVIENITVYF